MSNATANNSGYIKEYFRFPCDPIANPDAIVSGEKFRFTILTSRLIRMEYSDSGVFEDRCSQTFWYRNQAVPDFQVQKQKNSITIQTEHLVLKYKGSKKFSALNLSVKVKQTNKKWHYGSLEIKNLRGTARTLDTCNGPRLLEKGLISKDGFSVFDDSKNLVFNEDYWLTPRERSDKDLYFFGYGRDYLGCVKDFYKIAGKTPMIPRYILGNWWSRYWEYNEQELKQLINDFEKNNIPLSVCIIDMDWHLVKIDKKYGRGWTGYTWNKELFPDPPAMLKWLHEKNLMVSMNLHPADGIQGHEDCYEEVADFMGVDKTKEEPVKFDIADPKFVSAYFDLVHHPHEEQGVDFWWLDWQQGRNTGMKGLDPLWMLNHLHFYDLGRDGSKRPFIFSRWGKNGNHRYPIGFSGDTFTTWASLRFQPYFTATASNVGYGWWSHDIGGHYHGKEDPELFARWVQFGVFSPILRLHSSKRQYLKREPWRYDHEILKVSGDAMRLRHKLIPYLYSMAYRNYSDDIPLMCPLYYIEPNNKEAYKNKNEYWFGSELIASPIVKKMNRLRQCVLLKVYLPKIGGPYFDFFTKEYHEGGQYISKSYSLSDIPVFAKAGGIIPVNLDVNLNGTNNPEKIGIEIFPGASNNFELYEDDGVSENYKRNDVSITKLKLNWDEEEKNVSFAIELPEENKSYIPENRSFILRFNAIEMPQDIVVEGNNSLEYNSEYDERNKVLEVIVTVNSITTSDMKKFVISFKKPAIINDSHLNRETYQMLADARINNLIKEQWYKRYLSGKNITQKQFKKLYRKIPFIRF